MCLELKYLRYKMDEDKQEIHIKQIESTKEEIEIADTYNINGKLFTVTKLLNTNVVNPCIEVIKLPSTIKHIGQSAFDNAINLKTIEVDSNNKNYSTKNGILYNKKGNILIKCPQNYQAEKLKISKEVTTLKKEAFLKTKNLKEVDLSSIKNLGDYCFESSEIKSVKLPDSLEKIPLRCFNKCRFLENVNVPPQLIKIAGGAFNGCFELKEYNADNIDMLGMNAFSDTGLKNVVISKKLKYLNNDTYKNLDIDNLLIPSNIEIIQDNAFSNSDIKNLYIGSGLETTTLWDLSRMFRLYYLDTMMINQTKDDLKEYNDIARFCNNKNIKLITAKTLNELEENGFDYGQISQIIKGYESDLILSDLSIDTPVPVLRNLINISKKDKIVAMDMSIKLSSDISLEEKLDVYDKMNKLLNNDTLNIESEVIR